MRELIAVNRNITIVKDDNGWAGRAEIIIITSEPNYHLDQDFELKVRRRDCEHFRFLADEEQVTKMIEGLEKLRFDLQSAHAAITNANMERKAA